MTPARVLFCHPGAELYGSDRMAVASVRALVASGRPVTVVVPAQGPLVAEFEDAGATVRLLDLPVLRKSLLKPRPFLRLLFGMPRTLRTALRTIASEKPAALYVNTITQPWWLVAARLARVPALSHVREQESQVPWLVKRILTFPLVMADLILCNSRSTLDHVRQYGTGVARKLRVLYNGKDWSRYGQRPFAGTGKVTDDADQVIVPGHGEASL